MNVIWSQYKSNVSVKFKARVDALRDMLMLGEGSDRASLLLIRQQL